jgi:hypothetical protein
LLTKNEAAKVVNNDSNKLSFCAPNHKENLLLYNYNRNILLAAISALIPYEVSCNKKELYYDGRTNFLDKLSTLNLEVYTSQSNGKLVSTFSYTYLDFRKTSVLF